MWLFEKPQHKNHIHPSQVFDGVALLSPTVCDTHPELAASILHQAHRVGPGSTSPQQQTPLSVTDCADSCLTLSFKKISGKLRCREYMGRSRLSRTVWYTGECECEGGVLLLGVRTCLCILHVQSSFCCSASSTGDLAVTGKSDTRAASALMAFRCTSFQTQ